jgi:hypothetical protein
MAMKIQEEKCFQIIHLYRSGIESSVPLLDYADHLRNELQISHVKMKEDFILANIFDCIDNDPLERRSKIIPIHFIHNFAVFLL